MTHTVPSSPSPHFLSCLTLCLRGLHSSLDMGEPRPLISPSLMSCLTLRLRGLHSSLEMEDMLRQFWYPAYFCKVCIALIVDFDR